MLKERKCAGKKESKPVEKENERNGLVTNHLYRAAGQRLPGHLHRRITNGGYKQTKLITNDIAFFLFVVTAADAVTMAGEEDMAEEEEEEGNALPYWHI